MFRKTLLAAAALVSGAIAQDFTYCAKPIAENQDVILIEGSFTNEKISPAKISIEWHHNPAALDSFYITTPGIEKLLFITAGHYRVLQYLGTGAKRQIGARQMREQIGETPMKFDDLELLANGWFQCPDSSASDPNILVTAFPETQATLALDTIPLPREISVQRWNDDRSYSISQWKKISKNLLPEKVDVIGRNFSGTVKFAEVQTGAENK